MDFFLSLLPFRSLRHKICHYADDLNYQASLNLLHTGPLKLNTQSLALILPHISILLEQMFSAASIYCDSNADQINLCPCQRMWIM